MDKENKVKMAKGNLVKIVDKTNESVIAELKKLGYKEVK